MGWPRGCLDGVRELVVRGNPDGAEGRRAGGSFLICVIRMGGIQEPIAG